MAAQSRPPSKEIQKRISKRGAITDADIQQYIDEVGLANLSNMSMNDIAQFLKNYASLGQPKKKLPRKKKIEQTDSFVVADKGGELAKVSVAEQSKTEAPEAPAEDVATKSRTFKDYAKAAGLGLLGVGSMTFNKMFPTLGALMTAFQSRLLKQDKDLETVNQNNQENARQVSRSSVFLNRIVESQLRTNQLLEQIITTVAASGAALTPPPESGPGLGGGVDLRRRAAAQTPDAQGQQRSPAPQAGQAAATASQSAGGTRVSAPTAAPRASIGSGVFIAGMLGIGAGAAVASSASGATRPTAPTPSSDQPLSAGTPPAPPATRTEEQVAPRAQNTSSTIEPRPARPPARTGAAPEAVEPAIPSLPTPPIMTREVVTRTGTPITEQEQAELFANRVLNIKAKDIIFKADRFEFDQEPEAGGTAPAMRAPFVSSAAPTGGTQAAGAAAGTTNQIQNVVQRITQEFPAVAVTSGLRPGDTSSQHATGNAVDLSLRGLSQEQRATLVQNITSGRYGNVGGLGTYNAAGDLLHVDTRSGPRMAWGPNRSRTSLDQTPQWFQTAVMAWAGSTPGAAPTLTAANREQEPGPGERQITAAAASPAPSAPSTGARVAQASVQSEVSMMQSQQVVAQPTEGPSQPAVPTGSVEQSATMIDPNEPGAVEPPDAAQRYARLFDFAA